MEADRERKMVDDIRRARLLRDMESLYVPDYDAVNMPSSEKRAAYALEHIAFRMGRIEEKLERLLTALAALSPKS
jgi:hypothetical protein